MAISEGEGGEFGGDGGQFEYEVGTVYGTRPCQFRYEGYSTLYQRDIVTYLTPSACQAVAVPCTPGEKVGDPDCPASWNPGVWSQIEPGMLGLIAVAAYLVFSD